MMKLFAISDSALNRAVERSYDRMYDAFYGDDLPDRCCENCRYWDGTICYMRENECTEKDIDRMEASGDWSAIERDCDDYCEDHEFEEKDEYEYDPAESDLMLTDF